MKKSRFREEQMVTILREANRRPVPEVAKQHGVLSKNPIDAVRRADSTLDSPGRDVRDRREPLLGSPRMSPLPHVLQFLVVAVAGWINQLQRDVIDSLQEENRVRREQRGPGRLRVTAAQAKRLGRRVRRDLHTLVTPDTLIRWHRQLIARQYDEDGGGEAGRSCISVSTDRV